MPFKRADRSYYFEAVQLDGECDRELTWNYVARQFISRSASFGETVSDGTG